jgi:hypothetical protein
VKDEGEQTGNKKSKNWAHGFKPSGFQFTSLTEKENHWRNHFKIYSGLDQFGAGQVSEIRHFCKETEGTAPPPVPGSEPKEANGQFKPSAHRILLPYALDFAAL